MMLRCFCCVLLVSLISGCSPYTFNPGGESEIKSISVERFENLTDQYELTDRLTDIVIDAFIEDGNMKVLPRENAEAVLTGTLQEYRREPSDYDENDEVISYSVTMVFDIALKEPGAESDAWREVLRPRGFYQVASETEQDAQQEAIGQLVEEIINKTTKSW